MSLTKFIVCAVIFVIVFILIISGKARTLLKAFFNLFIEDLAATPEGADALYREKEADTEEKFRHADEVFKKIAGQRTRCKNELQQLNIKLSTIEKQCETLAAKGDEEGLDIKIEERQETIEDIETHKESLDKLGAAHEAAKEARNACEEVLNNIRRERRKIVSQMKQDRDMKGIYEDLEGIGANTETNRLLNRVREKSNDLSDVANGAKEAYETRTSTKARKVNQRLNSSANDDYKQKLMAKYKTTGGK